MPELPEVETISRQLAAAVTGKIIKSVDVRDKKMFVGNEDWLVGKKIKDVGRVAKMMVISFDDEEYTMLIHLKMTGRLIFEDGKRKFVEGNYTRIVITFSDESRLFFNDLRKFGWMKLEKTQEWKGRKEKMPVDVVEDDFDANYLANVLKKSNRAVKLVITDQAKMGGVGNIYANDALYLAGIMPGRKASSLSPDEVGKLCDAIKKVITLGIKMGGASAKDENYVNLAGIGGKYQEHFLVYERSGSKCKKCGGVIKKTQLGGRGTYYCGNCQK